MFSAHLSKLKGGDKEEEDIRRKANYKEALKVHTKKLEEIMMQGQTQYRNAGQVGDPTSMYGIVSTIGDGGNAAPGCSDHHSNGGKVHTEIFSKRYISYIGNNMDYEGFKSESWFNWKASYDEGWHRIPYEVVAASLNSAKWNAQIADSDSYKINACGFKISDICQMTTKSKSVASATEIESDMNPLPTIIVMHDPCHVTDHMCSNKDGSKVYTHNNDFQDAVNPTSQSASQLPRVKFGFDDEFLKAYVANTGGSSTNPDKFHTVDFFQDFPMQKYKSGAIIKHSWGGGTGWYPLGPINRQNPCYADADTNEKEFRPNIDLTAIKTTAFGQSVTPMIGMCQTMGVTQLNDPMINRPTPIYIKVYPYVGKDGPIDITCQLEIRYWCSISFKKRMCNTYPYPLLQNPNAEVAKAAAGNALKLCQMNAYTFNVPEAMRYPLNMFIPTETPGLKAYKLYGPNSSSGDFDMASDTRTGSGYDAVVYDPETYYRDQVTSVNSGGNRSPRRCMSPAQRYQPYSRGTSSQAASEISRLTLDQRQEEDFVVLPSQDQFKFTGIKPR